MKFRVTVSVGADELPIFREMAKRRGETLREFVAIEAQCGLENIRISQEFRDVEQEIEGYA